MHTSASDNGPFIGQHICHCHTLPLVAETLCISNRVLAAVTSSPCAKHAVAVRSTHWHAACNHAMPCSTGAPCQEEAPLQLHHEGAARSAATLQFCVGAYTTCSVCFVEALGARHALKRRL